MRSVLLVGWSLLLSFAAGCGHGEHQPVLRFSSIPDWNKATLQRECEQLAALLSERLGVEVRYQPSNDYQACVNGLAANKLDFAWLGGKTTCDAIDAGDGLVHVLATRDIDLKFKSYFIGNADAIAAGRVAAVTDLGEWRGHTDGLRFAFGSLGSTSGHLMPRYFLQQAGIVPEQAFVEVAYSGSHSNTLQTVANGSADLGALNYAHYDRVDAATKAKAPVLFTTPEYVDYAWVVHDRIGDELRTRLQRVLLGLSRGAADGREAAILDAWSAGAFLAARDEQWDAIRAVRDSLPKGFLTR